MMLKKILAFICALFLLSAAGCGNSISEKKDLKNNYSEQSSELTQTIDINSKNSDDASSDTENTEEAIINLQQIKYVKYDKTIQAEDGIITDGAKIEKTRKGYKGKGYVTGFNGNENKWNVSCELSDSQFYDIAVTAACDKAATGRIAVNGEIIGEMSFNGGKAFETFFRLETWLCGKKRNPSP